MTVLRGLLLCSKGKGQTQGRSWFDVSSLPSQLIDILRNKKQKLWVGEEFFYLLKDMKKIFLDVKQQVQLLLILDELRYPEPRA